MAAGMATRNAGEGAGPSQLPNDLHTGGSTIPSSLVALRGYPIFIRVRYIHDIIYARYLLNNSNLCSKFS